MIYPTNIEEKLGFNKIKQLIKELCLFNLGQQKAEEIKFLTSISEIEELLYQTVEFTTIINIEENFPLGTFIDGTKHLNKIKSPGTFIESKELLDLKKSLENCKNITYFLETRQEKYPKLYALSKHISIYPYIFDQFKLILTKDGNIKDNASKELQNIRQSIKNKQSSISKRLQHILKHAKTEGIIDDDVTISIREGRAVIPVIYTNKRKIKGYIHDESATGKTVYIEPAEIVEINNDIKDLEYAERREIVKILVNFADNIRPYINDLLLSYDFLAQIDFIRAKALFSKKIKAFKPFIHNETFINWKNAKHPVLFLTYKKENKKVVPLFIKLNKNKRILVISGPNAGGKSVCLQTVGLLQYMLQCGLPVPMQENSEAGIFNNIFIDIGDEQSIEDDLSTYSSHLLNMKFFTKNANNKTLFLIDEFGTGTEPMIGGAIAEAILDSLNQLKSYGVVTTHYTNLKHFASSQQGIENGAMLFDTHEMEPLFQLQMGEPGSSFAFEISKKIGVPEHILKSATQKIGQKHVDYDKNLKDIIRDKKYWTEKRENIKTQNKKLEKTIEEYTNELEKIEKLRKEILDKAQNEAQSLLNNTNKRIENTISEIRKIQAEKIKTKEIRNKLEEYKKSITHKAIDDDKLLNIKKQKVREKQKKLTKPKKQDIKTSKLKKSFEIGDIVKIKSQNIIGEIISISAKKAEIAVGNIKTEVLIKNIEFTENDKYKITTGNKTASRIISDYNLNKKKLNFKSQIDIRGKRVEEALEIVQQFIDEAIIINAKEVRILHGKGNGVLRQLVRQYLATIDVISFYKDEHVEHGGSGITVIGF